MSVKLKTDLNFAVVSHLLLWWSNGHIPAKSKFCSEAAGLFLCVISPMAMKVCLVAASFCYSERMSTKKMNTCTYENLCLSNKQDFILFTEVAQVLINCEHQLSLSPQCNFQIIKKNGRGREKRGEERENQSWSWVQTDTKTEGWSKGISNNKLMTH